MNTLRRFLILLLMSGTAGACTCEGSNREIRGDGPTVSSGQSAEHDAAVEQSSAVDGVTGVIAGSSSAVSNDSDSYAYDPSAPEVAAAHCQSCHVLPATADHRKRDWPNVMARMAYWMGMSDDELAKIEERLPPDEYGRIAHDRDELIRLGVIPSQPLIDAAMWTEVLDAYVAAADVTLPDPAASTSYENIGEVRVRNIGDGVLNGMVTSALRVDEAKARLLVAEAHFSGEGASGTVHVWSKSTGFADAVPFENPPTAIEAFGDDIMVTCIGDLFPSNERNGSLWKLSAEDGARTELLSGIPRTPHALPMGDGSVLVSSFGHEIGRLWIADETPDGTLIQSEVLVESPGAMESVAADIDGDGGDEYLVLFGQALDGIWVVERDREGDWSSRALVQRSPAFGHSDMSVADLDGDGDVDLLVANGDNLDLPDNPPRPYHGVRIYENDGAGVFAEAYFLPMQGAYAVEAGNFDADDELEIAAVAYFLQPDTEAQSFVVLDRDSNGDWKPFGADAVEGAQFCRIAVGNIDESPTDEIFLGGCYRRPPEPEAPRLVEVSFQ